MKRKLTIFLLKQLAKFLYILFVVISLLSGVLYYAFTGFGWLCLFGVVMEFIFDKELVDALIYLGTGIVCFVLRWLVGLLPALLTYVEASLEDKLLVMEATDMLYDELEDNYDF